MQTSTLSAKYQVVIPPSVRESLKLEPGRKMWVKLDGDEIRIRPIPTLEELQERCRGCGSDIQDDPDRF